MVVSDRTRCQLNTFIPSFLYYFDNIKIGLTLASQWDNHVHCHNLSNETSETVLVPSKILISVHVFINLSLPFNKISKSVLKYCSCSTLNMYCLKGV